MRTNLLTAIKFLGSAFFSIYSLVFGIYLMVMPMEDSSSADVWGIRYFIFVCLLAAVAYAGIARSIYKKAQNPW